MIAVEIEKLNNLFKSRERGMEIYIYSSNDQPPIIVPPLK
jgi:hypothetical protein